jgi:nucleotide-binding universal stress UspA family protein
MYDSIIVPSDGSPTSQRALAPAVQLARRWQAPIQLLTVMSPGLDTTETELELAQLSAEIDAPVLPPCVFPSNDVQGAIATHLDAHPRALLCLSTHGRSALASAVLGSTANALVRVLRSPFVLVGPRADAFTTGESVVVAIRPDHVRSSSAVEVASKWAAELGVELHVVSVCGGDVAEEVAAAATARGASVVVVGEPGAVALQVVRRAPVPVLVVPHTT